MFPTFHQQDKVNRGKLNKFFKTVAKTSSNGLYHRSPLSRLKSWLVSPLYVSMFVQIRLLVFDIRRDLNIFRRMIMLIKELRYLKWFHSFFCDHMGFASFLLMTGTGPIVAMFHVVSPRVSILTKEQHSRSSFLPGWYNVGICKEYIKNKILCYSFCKLSNLEIW